MKLRLKKLCCWILAVALLAGVLPTGSTTAQAAKPAVKCKAYVVMDAGSGKFVYRKNVDKKIYPASTVKLMTAIVTLEHAKLNKKIKFTKKMHNSLPSDAATLNLQVGSSYCVRQYLNMLLIVSDADSAMALAIGIAGSKKKFVSWMNEKAKTYGMSHTSFDNPVGLDIGNGYKKTYTTARDFAELARRAMSKSMIRKIVARSTYRVAAAKGKASFVIRNTNRFYSVYKLNGKTYTVIGTKTGTTGAAKHVLIATARDSKGHEVICSFFGGPTTYDTYAYIERLFDYTFSQCNKGKITLSTAKWNTWYN